MQEWLDRWVPYSLAAAKDMEPIWSDPEVQPVEFDGSFQRVRERFGGILDDLGLRMPQEVAS